jgi:periplasmic protein TonB
VGNAPGLNVGQFIVKTFLGLLAVMSVTSLSACVEAAPPQATAPEAPRSVYVQPSDMLSMPVPAYPASARRAGEQGLVIVSTLVDTAGQPTRVTVARPSGHYTLDQSAVDAVNKVRFRPYSQDGKIQAVWVFVPIRFELRGFLADDLGLHRPPP